MSEGNAELEVEKELVNEEQTTPQSQPETKEEPSEDQVREIKQKIADVTLDDDEEGPRTELVEDLREHVNIVFIGHVDAGKSTIAGNLLFLTGMVDDRTIAKYEREANEKKHGTWFLAYIMDTNEEERAKGKTVEVGRAHFTTEKKRFTILDAPGHKNYVPNMIGGAAQADVGILVISARKGEFESGFEGQGQTREHATLAKTLGVRQLIIAINKLDIEGYQQERWDEIQAKLTPFLRSVGYNPKTDIHWIPISGYYGHNIKEPMGDKCPWYKGPTLLQLLDDLQPIERSADGPVRLPVLDKYKSRGYTVLIGKIEAGTIQKGDKLIVYPNRHLTEVMFIELETGDVLKAKAGENVNVGIKDIEPTDVSSGFVLCSIDEPVQVVKEFEAQLAIIDLLPHKPILSAGYSAVIHVHTAVEEVSIDDLISVLNKKTKKPSSRKPTFVKKGDIVTARISLAKPICMELFSRLQQLGRFTLRDEGKTIAIGKTLKLYETTELAD